MSRPSNWISIDAPILYCRVDFFSANFDKMMNECKLIA